MDNKVVTSQHVKNIKTLSEEHNSQLQRAWDYEDYEVTSKNSRRERSASDLYQERSEGEEAMGRTAHGIRARSKRPMAIGPSVLNHVFECDCKSYSDAICSSNCESWKIVMDEELKALEDNGVGHLIKRQRGSDVLHTKWVSRPRQLQTVV